jgi:predicted NAD/FAD-dependent oxidoreductase
VEVVAAVAGLVAQAVAAEFDLDAGAQSLQCLAPVVVRLVALAREDLLVQVEALPVVQVDC